MILPRTPGDERAVAALREALAGGPSALRAALAEVEAIADGGAATCMVRAQLLRDLGRPADAVRALEQAAALAPDDAEPQYVLGLALADLGRTADALGAWRAAIRAEPTHGDALYNAGQALYNLGQHEDALAMWRRALELAPDDFFVLKKVAQAEHALGVDGAATRARIVALWKASTDPEVRGQPHYVFDQFDVGTWRVMALEPLADPAPPDLDVLRFTIDDRSGKAPFVVRLETSAYARSRGTPYVLTITEGPAYHVIEAFAEQPPYRTMRDRIAQLLASLGPRNA